MYDICKVCINPNLEAFCCFCNLADEYCTRVMFDFESHASMKKCCVITWITLTYLELPQV